MSTFGITPIATVHRSMSENWGNWFQPAQFIGRDTELGFLSRSLLQGRSSAVGIFGERGVGKTALAMAFGMRSRNSFPGGIYHAHANPTRRLTEIIDSQVSQVNSPYLLILDDLEFSSSPESELIELRSARPTARIIGVSRHLLHGAVFDSTLPLTGLAGNDLHELLERHGSTILSAHEMRRVREAVDGNPRTAMLVLQALRSNGGVLPSDIISLVHDFVQPGILGPDGRPISAQSDVPKKIRIDVISVGDELFRILERNPALMRELSSRKFEEVIAELLARHGYEITLTPASRDGGKDIYAAKKDDLGSFLFIVECKKYHPDNHVGVGVVRQLYGVVSAERATAGIVATTSFFTKDAKDFQQEVRNQMSLKDFYAIQDWLKTVYAR